MYNQSKQSQMISLGRRYSGLALLGSHLPLQRASLITDLPLSFIMDTVYRFYSRPSWFHPSDIGISVSSLSFPYSERLPIDRGPTD